MIAITHSGSITDIAYILPICSWLEKTKNEKIVFVFPKTTEDIESIVSLLKIQKFTHDVRLVNTNEIKFNPSDFVFDLKFTEYYNFTSPVKHTKYITDFQASATNLGIDNDFVLNLGLEFKYDANLLSITPGLDEVYPNYTVIYDHVDMLSALREFAYSKERHVNFNDVASYLALAKIPFYLYLFKKESGFYIDESKENFWLRFKDAPILDVRSFDSKRNITSIYYTIYFNQ